MTAILDRPSLDDLALMYEDVPPLAMRVAMTRDLREASERQLDARLAYKASQEHPDAHVRHLFTKTAAHHTRHARYHLFRLIGDGSAEDTLDTLPLWPRF